MCEAVERLLPDLLRTPPKLSCIVSDVFVQRAPALAARFGIPLFSFFASNATACCIMSDAPRLVALGIMPFQGMRLPDRFDPSRIGEESIVNR
jgi:hypothetical protein